MPAPRSPLRRIYQKVLRWPIVRRIQAPFIKARTDSLLTDESLAQKAVHAVEPEWRARIDDVLSCPDNAAIPRVDEAGLLQGNIVTMHNGVRVYAMSYYGAGVLNMLMENKGVHEPQEEKAFQEVIRHLPDRCTMLELGSYWAFYSLWLLAERNDAVCHMVEPDPACLEAGRLNFQLNGRQGHFEQAFVGAKDRYGFANLKTISVDGYCDRHRIAHLDILHADIQGKEVKMLHGAQGMLSCGAVDYVFISTHSQELHETCVALLRGWDYLILAQADIANTYSLDGLIVARRAALATGPAKIEIATKLPRP